MSSIDNYYLLLSLMHGLAATGLLLFLFLWQGLRTFRRGVQEPHDSNSLALNFSAILLAVFVTLGTVYLGEQVTPAFFLILGWSEAYLQRASARVPVPAAATTPLAAAPGMPRFRVIR